MALTLRERCQKRLVGLKAARAPFEKEAEEIATYAGPSRLPRYQNEQNRGTKRRYSKLNSSHGIFAFRTLQGGMTSGLSSQSRPWFTMATYDEELMHDQETTLWLAEVEKRMYAFLASTNFYGAVKTGYLDLGMIGTEACIMTEHDREGAVCNQLTFGEYWIGVGSALKADTLYRRCMLTSLQAYQEFEKDKLHPRIVNAYDQSDYATTFEFYHAIEPNSELETERADARGMAFRSVYWDEADDRKLNDGCVRISGYREQPFWAPRWDAAGNDAWGNGPGHDALPDLRELQLQAKRKGEATDHHIKPEKVASSKVRLTGQPGSVISVASSDLDISKLVHVPYQVPYQAIAAVAEDVRRCEESVDRAAYADLFMAITNMQGIQPRNIEEIASRNEEKLTQLGPVIERVNNEKLEVAIDRVFGIMERANLLPPPPESLAGNEIKIDFVSILTQMQRMVGLGQIERVSSFAGGLSATFPEVVDNVDSDEALREYAIRGGAPAKMIRSAADVEKIRAARAEQQNMERMIAAAPAAKDGAQAAKVMSEIDAGSLPMAGGPVPL